MSGLAYALDGRLAALYERHMVDECGYRTPDMVADELAAAARDVGPRWVELGAGTGLVGKAARARGISIELVAVDISESMLALIDCPLYVARHVADATSALPFEDASFDGAVAAGLLEHVPDPEPLLRNVARVLQGGELVFSYPPRAASLGDDLVSHEPSAIREKLAACGFLPTKEIDYPAYLNGSKGWVTHRLVRCRKVAAAEAGRQI
jgi:predicted TPR repeat methyltransferase